MMTMSLEKDKAQEDDENASEDDMEMLFQISEAGSAFLEAAFGEPMEAATDKKCRNRANETLNGPNAYLQVPIHPDQYHLLQFQWQGKTYQLHLEVFCPHIEGSPQAGSLHPFYTRVIKLLGPGCVSSIVSLDRSSNISSEIWS